MVTGLDLWPEVEEPLTPRNKKLKPTDRPADQPPAFHHIPHKSEPVCHA